MSDIFVSYKSEDQVRVDRLVRALQDEGFDLWWDRSLPGGESWRAEITKALEEAKCTVVVWTHASTGPGGQFVWDEAGRARGTSRLIPVLLDKVSPPLGFGELQAIDLTRWRGKRSDPFFTDLVAAIRAKMEGRPVPASKGPMWRLRRRLTAGGLVAVGTALLTAFASNTLKLQDRVCSVPIGQPAVSDACGALGLGSRPARAERLEWESRAQGDCEGLRRHLSQYAKGAYREEAQALLAARTVRVEESWIDGSKPQPLRLLVDTNAAPSATESEARKNAVERATKKGEQMCRDFDAAGLTQFKSVDVQVDEWTKCEREGSGLVCGFDGKALCWQQVLERKEREACIGSARP
jgi:TIR domain